MRILLITAISAAALLFGSALSQAYEGPWCAVVNVGAGTVVSDCHFMSIEACRPNVIAGNRGFCTQNPRWPGYYAPLAEPAKRHRKRHAQRH